MGIALILASHSFLLAVGWNQLLIQTLRRYSVGERIRIDGPRGHQVKLGTPRLGGLLIVVPVVLITVALNICNLMGRTVIGHSILSPPGDEAALARHLARLIADAGLRHRMGAASRRLAEAHSLERVAAQYERLCREVAAAPPPSFPPAWMRRGGWLWGVLASGSRLVRGLKGRNTY